MKDEKTSLTKKEKEIIKEKRPTRTMSAEEWAEVQGMTQAELRGKSSVGSFLDEMEKKYKK
mgnify:FL=1|jgi:hypothetical protein